MEHEITIWTPNIMQYETVIIMKHETTILNKRYKTWNGNLKNKTIVLKINMKQYKTII